MPVIQFSTQAQYLSVKQVAARYSVAVSTIWKWTKLGKFPEPRKLNNCTRWHVDDLVSWEASQDDIVVNE